MKQETKAARKAKKAANRKRNDWMIGFAASTIENLKTFNLVKRSLGH